MVMAACALVGGSLAHAAAPTRSQRNEPTPAWEQQPKVQMSDEQIADIVGKLHEGGLSLPDIAKRSGRDLAFVADYYQLYVHLKTAPAQQAPTQARNGPPEPAGRRPEPSYRPMQAAPPPRTANRAIPPTVVSRPPVAARPAVPTQRVPLNLGPHEAPSPPAPRPTMRQTEIVSQPEPIPQYTPKGDFQSPVRPSAPSQTPTAAALAPVSRRPAPAVTAPRTAVVDTEPSSDLANRHKGAAPLSAPKPAITFEPFTKRTPPSACDVAQKLSAAASRVNVQRTETAPSLGEPTPPEPVAADPVQSTEPYPSRSSIARRSPAQDEVPVAKEPDTAEDAPVAPTLSANASTIAPPATASDLPGVTAQASEVPPARVAGSNKQRFNPLRHKRRPRGQGAALANQPRTQRDVIAPQSAGTASQPAAPLRTGNAAPQVPSVAVAELRPVPSIAPTTPAPGQRVPQVSKANPLRATRRL